MELNPAARESQGSVWVKNACLNNLHDVTVEFPLGVLTVVSGVAGSGKSSLVKSLVEQQPRVSMIDQAPLMATRRSSLLTTLGIASAVRQEFSVASGLDKSWFSANGKGACPACKGRGVIRVDMAFMDDVETVCERCGGQKFNDKAIGVKLTRGNREWSIADVLNASLDEVNELFSRLPKVKQVINLVSDVGLEYLTLGQTLDTLSGGELQRIKLVKFLEDYQDSSDTVIVLDEPTTGLHSRDVAQLANFCHELVNQGLTVIVVDHNLGFIARADHVIDIGPGAGEHGGSVIYSGNPQGLIRCSKSVTGSWLRKAVEQGNTTVSGVSYNG
ncbi:ATP-binding cassette domain-containing protein [Gleimia hominis]|uniref:UvrABC system protein A n=1 Tax=Gleimia hominis TaxID=595468 RepID=A0ABU3ICK1_9ACTO|nr:ATP-binding cassette domain-containing protein [Gleimia hominis]MDT3766940.1 ATP-binding cassette domain-containing protein [Gleimia hominis]